MPLRHFFSLLFSALLLTQGFAEEIVEDQLAKHFSSRGLNGCFVMLDVKTDTTHVWNPDRAKQRFRPASTFKIPNAIIGLEAKAVRDLDEVIPYGGTKELLPAWEKDMNLREAMKVSNVAVFHQLAKRAGLPAIKRSVTEFSYGNKNVGNDIENRFWLKGPLKISANEQVAFLTKLATSQLKIRKDTKTSIRELIHFKTIGKSRIYAKTGWVGPKGRQIGWWVGWVQKEQAVYSFALNLDIKASKDAKERVAVGLECLQSLGIIDAK